MYEEIRCQDRYITTLETLVVGPLKITAHSRTEMPSIEGPLAYKEEVFIPLATYERPLYICVNRGAKVSREIKEGINVLITNDIMTRAPVIEARDIIEAADIAMYLEKHPEGLREIAESTTRYGKLVSIRPFVVGNHIYVRLAMQCGDAAGHNMTTKAATEVTKHILERFPHASYISDSGNVCTDKKAGAVNAITGRGKSAVTEMTVKREVCEKVLKTTPEAIERLNIAKNLQGSIAAGAQFSANAHYANIVAAMYVATGQDLANVVEGSFGLTQARATSQGDLYFTTTMQCLIVGTVGSGKDGHSQRKSLGIMGCAEEKPLGFNSQRLAAIIAGAAAVGELSLLADQTIPGKLIRSHEKIERS